MRQRKKSESAPPMSEEDTKRAVVAPESSNMNLPNPYYLVGVSLLVVIALTQYFAIRSENVVLTVQIMELKQQLKDSEIRLKEKHDYISNEEDSCLKDKYDLKREKESLALEIEDLTRSLKNTHHLSVENLKALENKADCDQRMENLRKAHELLEEAFQEKIDVLEKGKLNAEQQLKKFLDKEPSFSKKEEKTN